MSLLYKPLESITAADLHALIQDKVRESLYIEYKTDVDKRDEKKTAQFLGSVSGFANVSGGDFLIGVDANEGLPVGLPGINAAAVDAEMLRIRQIVGTSVEPQLVIQLQSVSLFNDRAVLIIRIPRSWSAPHGVKHNGHFQFFRRHSAGRAPMTLSELRTAFTLSSTIVELTRRFRSERLAALVADGPWPYQNKPVTVLHIMPFGSAMDAINLDPSKCDRRLLSGPFLMDPSYSQQNHRYNLDGIVIRDPYTNWHTQLFRNGSLEYAISTYFSKIDGKDQLDAFGLQVNLVNVVSRFLKLQEKLGIAPPVTVMLSLLNVANYFLRIGEGYPEFDNRLSEHQIDRERVLLPDLVVNDLREEPIPILKPLFDALWNAAGLERCGFYRSEGQWNLDPSWLDKSEK